MVGAAAPEHCEYLACRSSADLHKRVNEEVASKVGDLVHTSLQPAFDLGKKVTLLVITNSGSLGWGHQQAAERLAGAVPSRAPWTIRVVAQDVGGTEKARSTSSCLPRCSTAV